MGTETDGSILNPAAMNGIVGIKPTVGLVSRSGIIPISHRQDTAGPMARSVSDAAALLSVLAGPDAEDMATADAPPAPDYCDYLDPDGLKGARIGIARAYCGFHEGIDAILADCLAAMRAEADAVLSLAAAAPGAVVPTDGHGGGGDGDALAGLQMSTDRRISQLMLHL